MKKLSNKMMRLAEYWVAHPTAKVSELAELFGVDDSTIYRWSHDDKYLEYQHELCIERFKSFEKLALEKLQENAMNNNQRAIEYMLDYIGYKPSEKVDVNADGININVCIKDE